LVVSTQVIEAGVDLSFQKVFRARPILPSIIQAAGRANRHAEGEKAEVVVFDFLREGRIDTRNYVYTSAITREITDALLPQAVSRKEKEAYGDVDAYYRELISRCPMEGGKDLLQKAALGDWCAVSRLEVFEEHPSKQRRVFVPFEYFPLPEEITTAMARFGLNKPLEIYEKYCEPGWFGTLDFRQRKAFMALLMQFTVPVTKAMNAVLETDESKPISLLKDQKAYNQDTGLGAVWDDQGDH